MEVLILLQQAYSPNPSELIWVGRLEKVVAEFKSEYD